MAANFRIISQRKGCNFHLKLRGDFDGMSAMELIYALKENLGFSELIFIDTDGLCCLYPFGRDVFQKNFMFPPAIARRICFTGALSNEFTPANKGAVPAVLTLQLRPEPAPQASHGKHMASS